MISIPVVLILKTIRLPVIVGFLLTGALLGHGGIGLITNEARIEFLAELGLALLLFSIGLEFSLDRFRRIRKKAVFVAISQVILTFLLGTLMGHLLDWPLIRCIYFGCVLSLSSSAVVMTTMHGNRMMDSVPGQLSTTILVIQDLAFIPMFVLLPIFAFHNSASTPITDILFSKVFSLAALIVIVVIGRTIILKLLNTITIMGQREIFVIAVMSVGLGMSWLTAKMGLSFALGAFLAGLLIGLTDFKYQALSEVTPFRYCFNSLFFVSIGLLVNFTFIAENWATILGMLAVIPLIKFGITLFASNVAGFPFKVGIITALSIAQIGEFSFLIIQNGYKNNIIGSFLHDLIIATAVIAMAITPLFIHYAPFIATFVAKLFKREQHVYDTDENKKQKNHAIICGFGPLGRTMSQLLKKHSIPYTVLELNAKTIQNIKKENIPVFFGDGASEEILHKSDIEHARLMAITVPFYLDNIAIIKQAKTLNPNIKIITRAKYSSDVEKLYNAGADVVISEELEGGIEMGRYALKMASVPVSDVDDMIMQVRAYGSADFFEEC